MNSISILLYGTLLLSTGFYAADESYTKAGSCSLLPHMQGLSTSDLSNKIHTASYQSAKHNPFSDAPIPQNLSVQDTVLAAVYQLSYYQFKLKQTDLFTATTGCIQEWLLDDADRAALHQNIHTFLTDLPSTDEKRAQLLPLIKEYLIDWPKLHNSDKRTHTQNLLRQSTPSLTQSALAEPLLLLATPDIASLTKTLDHICARTSAPQIQNILCTLRNLDWSQLSTTEDKIYKHLSHCLDDKGAINVQDCCHILFAEFRAILGSVIDLNGKEKDPYTLQNARSDWSEVSSALDLEPARIFHSERVGLHVPTCVPPQNPTP